MDEPIDFLLSSYEEEKKTLLHLIESLVKEEEYLFAHYHSEALYRINRNIRTLMMLKDRHHDDIEMHKKSISIYSELLQQVMGNEYLIQQILQNISREKKLIEELESESEDLRHQKIENHFDQALESLLDRKIKYIKLYLKRKDDFYFKITYSRRKLHLRLSSLKKHTKSWLLNDKKIHALKTLDFVLSDNESRLMHSIQGSREEIFNRIRIIISKIVFEIFYAGEFENESFLEIG